VLEGEAGFYHAYAGNNRGDLRYSFAGDNHADLAKITEGLGRDWIFLETLYRIYSTAGYNIAHIDVTAALCAEHGITPDQIDRIEAVVNWLETEYPSPLFPSRGIENPPSVGSTQYFTAYGAVARGYPLLRGQPGPGESDPPEVLFLEVPDEFAPGSFAAGDRRGPVRASHRHLPRPRYGRARRPDADRPDDPGRIGRNR
jgi:hypothetical protein